MAGRGGITPGSEEGNGRSGGGSEHGNTDEEVAGLTKKADTAKDGDNQSISSDTDLERGTGGCEEPREHSTTATGAGGTSNKNDKGTQELEPDVEAPDLMYHLIYSDTETDTYFKHVERPSKNSIFKVMAQLSEYQQQSAILIHGELTPFSVERRQVFVVNGQAHTI